MGVLSKLEPERVFEYFEKLSAIPRGSGKTRNAAGFCIDFAKEHGLRFTFDEAGNVVIYKNGSKGRENEPPVILQGHLDMVWEKAEGCTIDFEHDPLTLETDGESITAKGTTLGGDDGIAVAMCLAVLESDELSHPPIEAVFTVDEEIGMLGARALDCSVLSGKRMINIDSEDESTLWVSCAGGERADISLAGKRIPASGKAFRLSVSGLHGGHSGTEINRGYQNANKVLGKVLYAIAEEDELMISSVCGGTMDNAITRESECVFHLLTDENSLRRTVDEWRKKLGIMLSVSDPGFTLTLTEAQPTGKAFNANTTAKIIGLLCELPSGVVEMSSDIEGLVETSLNLGVLKTEGDTVRFCFSVRSAKDKKRAELLKQLCTLAGIYGADVDVHSGYPAWEFREDSPLRTVMAAEYKRLNGKEMKITAVHAGLECGIFCGKISGLDCVSVGPDIFDIHTPGEKLSVPSCKRVWEFLLAVLEKI